VAPQRDYHVDVGLEATVRFDATCVSQSSAIQRMEYRRMCCFLRNVIPFSYRFYKFLICMT
jgi:hypothetical protein